MEDNTKKVEAIIFAVGKEITTERISSLCALETKEVDKIMNQLMKQYSDSNNALKVVQKENGWKLTVKDEYLPLVSSIVSSTELDRPLMDTLAVIAWRYPIIQSEIIKLRGSGAYEHMRALEEQGFVAKERFGRTYKVKLTQKFFEYFDLPSEEAKEAFLKNVPAEVLKNAEDIDKESDEVDRLIELDKKEKVGKSEIGSAMKEMQESDE
jgi:segregation and condensation protein B